MWKPAKVSIIAAGRGISCSVKAVLVDASEQVWAIDNPDSVKNFYGDHVSVKATADATNKSVHIDTIADAK